MACIVSIRGYFACLEKIFLIVLIDNLDVSAKFSYVIYKGGTRKE